MSKHMPEPNKCNCGREPITMSVGTQYQIGCPNCARSGATCQTLTEAIADWNRQTAAPDLLEHGKAFVKAMDGMLRGTMNLADVTRAHNRFSAAIALAEPK